MSTRMMEYSFQVGAVFTERHSLRGSDRFVVMRAWIDEPRKPQRELRTTMTSEQARWLAERLIAQAERAEAAKENAR